jgi:hypothetical protein
VICESVERWKSKGVNRLDKDVNRRIGSCTDEMFLEPKDLLWSNTM